MKCFVKLLLLSILICHVFNHKKTESRRLRRIRSPPAKLHLEAITQVKSTQPSTKGIELISLADHQMDCGIGLMAGYKLEKVGATKYKYNFTCLQPDPKKCNSEIAKKIEAFDKVKCKPHITAKVPINVKDPKNTEVMGGLSAQCPPQTAMKAVRARFTKEPNPKIYYEFTCCPAKTNACGKKFTSELSYTKAEKTLLQLDRFDVACPDIKTQALTGFSYTVVPKGKNKDTDWKMKYEIRYCSIFG